MRVLSVYAEALGGLARYRYLIYETSDGDLYWRYHTYSPETTGPFLRIPGTGSLDGGLVDPEAAKIITGIDDECAMDRLREMLHDSEESCP